jgi:pimeloyl-ACP methyl ester carboxylesterase
VPRWRDGTALFGNVDTFYREAGREDALVRLLPHGYPCSSYEFRNLMPRLADRWRLVAPDYPGAGYSGTPDDFDYSFEGYAAFLCDFLQRSASTVLRSTFTISGLRSEQGLRSGGRRALPH